MQAASLSVDAFAVAVKAGVNLDKSFGHVLQSLPEFLAELQETLATSTSANPGSFCGDEGRVPWIVLM